MTLLWHASARSSGEGAGKARAWPETGDFLLLCRGGSMQNRYCQVAIFFRASASSPYGLGGFVLSGLW